MLRILLIVVMFMSGLIYFPSSAKAQTFDGIVFLQQLLEKNREAKRLQDSLDSGKYMKAIEDMYKKVAPSSAGKSDVESGSYAPVVSEGFGGDLTDLDKVTDAVNDIKAPPEDSAAFEEQKANMQALYNATVLQLYGSAVATMASAKTLEEANEKTQSDIDGCGEELNCYYDNIKNVQLPVTRQLADTAILMANGMGVRAFSVVSMTPPSGSAEDLAAGGDDSD